MNEFLFAFYPRTLPHQFITSRATLFCKNRVGCPIEIIRNLINVCLCVCNCKGKLTLRSTAKSTIMYKLAETMPERRGERIHEVAISIIFSHLIPSVPRRSNVKPSVAPTIECVVETGSRRIVAIINQTPPPKICKIYAIFVVNSPNSFLLL